MSKILIGILYVIGLICLIVGVVLLIQSIPGGTTTVNQYGGRTSTPGNIPLFVIGLTLTIVGIIPILAAEIGALLNVMRPTPNWTWFIWLLVLSIFTIPVYLFIGPSREARQSLTDSAFQTTR